MQLRRLLLRCADALAPADVVVVDRAVALAHSHELGAVVRVRIADLLEDGPQTAASLAQRAGCNADALHRTLRSLVSVGVFALDQNGRFSNNRVSRALTAKRMTRASAMVEYFTSASNTSAWADFGRTLASGRNAFARVHGMNVWQWFAAHPDEEQTFADAMLGFTLADAPFVIAQYPFGELERLCDLGGGRGTLISELVLRFPKLQAALYENSSVLQAARRLFEERGVADRVECIAGSFFDAVPPGYDAYLLKHVLHDWDDSHCNRILVNVRRAIPPEGKLLLVEAIVERDDATHVFAGIDVHMMVACEDGRERSQHEFERLLAAAGFKLARVCKGPTLAVIEALPV